MKILSMADISACPDLFSILAGKAEVVELPPDQQLLKERIGEFDVYFSSLKVRADAEVLARATKLKAIATPTTGLDHIDLAAAQARGVEIISLKEEIEFLSSVTATAEMAWALMLAVARRLPWGFEAAKAGCWARDEFRGHQLSGKTLGVLGYGRLGRIIAEYGHAFRMKVLACDRKPRGELKPAPFVELVDFETLLRESDVLSIHIHLTPENRGLLNHEAFAQMKRGAILLNTSRGAIIDENALLESLESGHLGGAGLDVVEGEWRDDLSAHPLIRYANTHQNLVISPHVGGVTVESQRAAYERTAQKLLDFLNNFSEPCP